ncbi:major facilitator superfamily domain-containing protein 4A isoform X1 [Alosa sapidissima]|uniref:major facilitator superfamily domain-containing protein 4A isoform X1 n=1 Tax=Alosa sapidissima TaxID=34773 RepID=UPI001C0990FF|nr:major facilitator superfamily domain-containing protein 4A isoform X1 [Alosa sapidissima]
MQFMDSRVWSLFKNNWQYTLTYWSAFFSFGLCVAFLGPTILDLRCQTHSSLQEITWVFFAQQLFLFVGSSIGGFFNKSLRCSLSALAVCTLVISVVFAMIPLCHRVLALAVAMAVAGMAMGIIDTIANFQLVKLYQKDSTIFLQILHFFVGLGALLSPLIADPFLSETPCMLFNGTINIKTNNTMRHMRNTLNGIRTHMSQFPFHTEGEVVTNVSYAFWIMALINLPVPIAVFVLMYRERLIACGSGARTRLLERDELAMRAQGSSALTTTPSQSSLDNSSLFSCCRYGDLTGQPLGFVGIHVLAGMVLFFSDGIVGAYEGFVYSYAVAEPMSLPHKTAGYLTSVFWAAITAGRLAAIPLSYRFPASRQLTVNQIGIMCTLLMLLMLYTSPAFLFIGTLVLGLFISSVYPSMLAFTEDMLNYRGCATTLLVTSASMGEMFLQLLVGSVMHSQGSYSFMVCGVIFSILGLSSYLLLLYCWRIYSAQSTGDVEKNTKVENADVNGVNH